MSRPRSPLLPRLANLLSIPDYELQTTLASWPSAKPSDYPCLHGPRIITFGGSTRTIMNTLFELILDQPLHKSWRPHRLCGIGTCRNPLHYELRVVHYADGTVHEELPMRCFQLQLEAELAGEVEDDPEDVIDTILSVEEGRTMTPEALSARFYGLYSLVQFDQALKTIHATGL